MQGSNAGKYVAEAQSAAAVSASGGSTVYSTQKQQLKKSSREGEYSSVVCVGLVDISTERDEQFYNAMLLFLGRDLCGLSVS